MAENTYPNDILSSRETEELADLLESRGIGRLEEIAGQVQHIWEDQAGRKYTARLQRHVRQLQEVRTHLLQAQELLTDMNDESSGEE